MNARIDLRPIALAAILTVAPAWVAAARAPFDARVVMTATTVHAGDLVELRWNTLPSNVEELEILLSLDGGRHYAVRVTPECDPRAGRYLWRVPNLATSSARLRLRLGVEEREIEAEPGTMFEIVAPPEFDRFHENGWWSGLVHDRSRPGAGLAAPRAALGSARDGQAVSPAPRDEALPAPGATREIARAAPRETFAGSIRRPASLPRFTPLRN
jgi:hypothetical protein